MASIIIGIIIYLGLPYSLLTLNISILVLIFFGLLTALLVGLMMIFVNFTYLIENMLTLPLFVERGFVRMMVIMNLVSHRIRNRRTVIIYGLGLSFINFIYVTLLMQIETSQNAALRGVGSELAINNGIELGALRDVFAKTNLTDSVEIAIVPSDLFFRNLRGAGFSNYTIMNKGKIVSIDNLLYGVAPNFFNVAKTEFNNAEYEQKRSSLDPI